jgi:DNA-binding response OmpR family regulator
LVDDQEEYLETVAERMTSRGLDVTVARDGQTALDLASTRDFDVVLLDMQMPGMDGIETLRRLRERNVDLEVVLVTGFGSVEKSVAAMKLGAADFVQKPVDIEVLVAKAREARETKLLLVEAKLEDRVRAILTERGW